jgi:RNA-directed DNA polymerase
MGRIPTFEDKVAQRAIAMLLEPIYEQDFLPCSYGFRPRRSAHDALHALRTAFMTQGLRWVLDVVIVKYFIASPTAIRGPSSTDESPTASFGE